MLYQVETAYTEEAYSALAYLMICKLRKWPRIVLLITGIVSIVGSALMMIYEGRISAAACVVLLLGNAVSLFALYAQKFAVRMMMAANKKGETPVNTYLFSATEMKVQNGQGEREYSYSFISRVIDMSGYLFFFCRDGQVYMLKEDNLKGQKKAFMRDLQVRLEAARKG